LVDYAFSQNLQAALRTRMSVLVPDVHLPPIRTNMEHLW
jgi:hypothetical protein